MQSGQTTKFEGSGGASAVPLSSTGLNSACRAGLDRLLADLNRRLILILAVTTGLSIALAFLLAGSISGPLRRLARSILRRCAPDEIVTDNPRWTIENAWPFGDLYVLEQVWKRLGIPEAIAKQKGSRKLSFWPRKSR